MRHGCVGLGIEPATFTLSGDSANLHFSKLTYSLLFCNISQADPPGTLRIGRNPKCLLLPTLFQTCINTDDFFICM